MLFCSFLKNSKLNIFNFLTIKLFLFPNNKNHPEEELSTASEMLIDSLI